LTFDDGHSSQLKVAIPMMNKLGIRGTFYLCPRGNDFAKKLEPWKEVFAAGHEIGNHSISHSCSRNFEPEPGAEGLETMTLDDIEADVVEAERRLQSLFPVEDKRSFCYPCYQTDVGEGATRTSYVPIIAKHFIAARTRGEYGFFNNPYNADLHHLWSMPCERKPGSELIGLVELAVKRGQWIIFTFHAFEGSRLGTNAFDFEQLLEHLAENRDRIWTAPVAEIARHLIDLRARYFSEKSKKR